MSDSKKIQLTAEEMEKVSGGYNPFDVGPVKRHAWHYCPYCCENHYLQVMGMNFQNDGTEGYRLKCIVLPREFEARVINDMYVYYNDNGVPVRDCETKDKNPYGYTDYI